jgi:hypothetical protein
MITARTLVVVALGFVLSAHLQGQSGAQYRDFQLGGSLPSVSALAGLTAADAKTIHERPAVMQQLDWRPPYYVAGSTTPRNDSVRQIVFSFYNDQLSKMVVDYDRARTGGLTDADVIEALSMEYGSPLQPARKKGPAVVASQFDTEFGTPVARWGDANYSVVLYRSLSATFRIVVTSARLDALSRTADAQALQLDLREAPQREIARQKKEVDDTRASEERARVTNKASFKP